MSNPHSQDPYTAFRFSVAIDGIQVGGFSDVSGLDLTTTTHDYAEGGTNDHMLKFAGPITQSNIVLKRGIVDRVLWDWYASLLQGRVIYRSGSITIHDPTGQESEMRVDFMRAFPAKWTGPTLGASQSAVAVEAMELAHHGIEWQNG